MGVGSHGVEVAKNLMPKSRAADIPAGLIHVIDVGMSIRGLSLRNWHNVAGAFADKVIDFMGGLKNCPQCFLVGDRYDLNAPHREWISQKRARPPAVEVNVSDYMNLATAPEPGKGVVDVLMANRQWRLNTLMPAITDGLLNKIFTSAKLAKGSSPIVVTRGLAKHIEEDDTVQWVQVGSKKSEFEPTYGLDEDVKADTAEADTYAVSLVLHLLDQGKDVVLTAGDLDLLFLALRIAETYLACRPDIKDDKDLPAFFMVMHAPSKMGKFNIWQARKEMRVQLLAKMEGPERPLPKFHQYRDQLVDLGIAIPMLGGTDYVLAIPYLTAEYVFGALPVFYDEECSSYPVIPTDLEEYYRDIIRGKVAGCHPGVLVYRTLKGFPVLNYAAWFNLIAVAAGMKLKSPSAFSWYHTVMHNGRLPPHTAAPRQLSLGQVTATLARLEWALQYNAIEPIMGYKTPDFLNAQRSTGFFRNPATGRIEAVEELDPRPFLELERFRT